MDFGILFLLVLLVSPSLILAGLVWGDYKAEGKLPWKDKKDDTNSGAKFG